MCRVVLAGALSLAAAVLIPAAAEDIEALIEIPAGSIVKYEIASGRLRVDRFQSMPVA